MDARDLLTDFWSRIEPYAERILEEPYRSIALAILAVTVLLIVYRRLRRARRPILLYRSDGGNVEIANGTLRALIISAAERVRGVEHASCSYGQRRRKLGIRLSIHLAGDAKLKRVEEELKAGIREALSQHVAYNPDDVQPIDVRVTRITGNPAPIADEEPVRETRIPPDEAPLADASLEAGPVTEESMDPEDSERPSPPGDERI